MAELLWPSDGMDAMNTPLPSPGTVSPKARTAISRRKSALRQLHAALFPED